MEVSYEPHAPGTLTLERKSLRKVLLWPTVEAWV